MAVIKVHSEDGVELDARAEYGEYSGMKGIFLHSQSGGKNGQAEKRNTDYNKALAAIISRFQQLKVSSLNIWIVSKELENTDMNARKICDKDSDCLILDGSPEEVRKKIGREQASIVLDKNPLSKTGIKRVNPSQGGNRTKKNFIQTDICKQVDSINSIILGSEISSVSPDLRPPETLPSNSRLLKSDFYPSLSEIDGRSDISLSEDRRERVIRSIFARRGQPKFRKSLMKAYNGRCAVTGCKVDAVLEAAHIAPYRGEHTNDISNGVLLRADWHLLFDLGLFYITEDYHIVISQEIKDSSYWQYNGQKLTILPEHPSERPSKQFLKQRPRPD